jgi:hypothetical protein
LQNANGWRILHTMMNPSRDQQVVSFLEDAICAREQAVTEKLSAGLGGTNDDAAIAKLYRTLRVAHNFQAHRASQHSTWLSHFL